MRASFITNTYIQKKLWSTTPTSPYCCNLGEGLIQAVYQRQNLYSCKRIDTQCFQVKFNYQLNKILASENADDETFEGVPLPIFCRIREVTVLDTGIMECSCFRFQSRGIFCEHCVCVAKFIYDARGETFHGFTHHDVAARYRTDVLYYAYKNSTPSNVQQMFHMLLCSDVNGPRLRKKIPDCIEILQRDEVMPAIDRLINYSKDGIDLEMIDGMFVTSYVPTSTDGDTPEVNDVFETMFQELQNLTPESSMVTFDTAISNSSLPSSIPVVSSRSALRSLVETSYALADKIGPEAIQNLEVHLKQFNSWCSIELSKKECKNQRQQKRKYVALTQETYEGNVQRVYNTYHMH